MNFFKKNSKEKQALARVKLEFRMAIDDLFFIRDIGAVVTGNVESGTCRIGETAVITHNGVELEAVIAHIIKFSEGKAPTQETAACPNERVGLGLQGVTREQLENKVIEIGDLVIVRNGQAELM